MRFLLQKRFSILLSLFIISKNKKNEKASQIFSYLRGRNFFCFLVILKSDMRSAVSSITYLGLCTLVWPQGIHFYLIKVADWNVCCEIYLILSLFLVMVTRKVVKLITISPTLDCCMQIIFSLEKVDFLLVCFMENFFLKIIYLRPIDFWRGTDFLHSSDDI